MNQNDHFPFLIAPAVVAADFSRLDQELERAAIGGADFLHLDIMDAHFVPNLSFGADVVVAIRQLTDLPLEVHLMMSRPLDFLERFVEAGASSVIIHLEAEACARSLRRIKEIGCKAGLAIKPATSVKFCFSFFGKIDRLLCMTVEPGFGGHKLLPETLVKVAEARRLRNEGGYEFDIGVEGGLNRHTVTAAARAGASVIIAGTSIFKAPDAGTAIAELRNGANSAWRHAPSDTYAPCRIKAGGLRRHPLMFKIHRPAHKTK
jgi:ribulose-phosphate 3-epimerase